MIKISLDLGRRPASAACRCLVVLLCTALSAGCGNGDGQSPTASWVSLDPKGAQAFITPLWLKQGMERHERAKAEAARHPLPEVNRGEAPTVVRGLNDRKNVIPAETFDSYAMFVKRFAEKNPGQTWARFRADMDAAHAKFQVEIKIPDIGAARAVLDAVSKTPGLAEAAKEFAADLRGKLQSFEQGARELVDTATLLRESVAGAVNGTHQAIQKIEALRDMAEEAARAEIARILDQDVPAMFAALESLQDPAKDLQTRFNFFAERRQQLAELSAGIDGVIKKLSPFLTPEQRRVLKDLVDQTQATLGQAAQLATSMYMMGEAATSLAAALGVAPWVAAAVLLIMFLIALFKGGGGGGGDGKGDGKGDGEGKGSQTEAGASPHQGSAPTGQSGEGKPGHPGSGLPGRGDKEVVPAKKPEALVAKEMGRLQSAQGTDSALGGAPNDGGVSFVARWLDAPKMTQYEVVLGWKDDGGSARAERLFLDASSSTDLIRALRELEGAGRKANLKLVSITAPGTFPITLTFSGLADDKENSDASVTFSAPSSVSAVNFPR